MASALVSAVKFVNSFARRQHLFDITVKHFYVVSCSPVLVTILPKM